MNFQQCAGDCQDCHDICLDTIYNCLKTGGELSSSELIQVLHHCASICHTCKDLMLYKPELCEDYYAMCANVCFRCAEVCESSGLVKCALICRQCEKSCREMVSLGRGQMV